MHRSSRTMLVASIVMLVIASLLFALSPGGADVAEAAFTHLTNLSVRYNLTIGPVADPVVDIDTDAATLEVPVTITGASYITPSLTISNTTGALTLAPGYMDWSTSSVDVEELWVYGRFGFMDHIEWLTGTTTLALDLPIKDLRTTAPATVTVSCGLTYNPTVILMNTTASDIVINTTGTRLGSALTLGQYDVVTFYCPFNGTAIPLSSKDN